MNEVSRIVGSTLTSPFLEMLPVTGVAISVFDQNRHSAMLHATDHTAQRLEELHFDVGEGPLFDAFVSGTLIAVPDVAQTERWPAFVRGTAELDVGALFVFPLMLGAICTGAVICYRITAGPLDSDASDTGESLARAIAGPSFREAIVAAVGEAPDEEAPIEWRRQVHQATGMVLAQLDITASDAFSRIRAYAFSRGLTVEDVATDVIDRRLNFADPPRVGPHEHR